MANTSIQKPSLSEFNLTRDDVDLYLKYRSECEKLACKVFFISLLIIIILLISNFGLAETIVLSMFIIPLLVFPLYGIIFAIIENRKPSIHEKGKKYKEYTDSLAKFEHEYTRTLEAFWCGLNGYQFEEEVANLYKKLGYKVKRTGKSGDGGIDIILINSNNETIIVQCKAHKNRVGPSVIRDLYGTMTNKNAKKAILVSLSGCTSGVYAFARGKNIDIITKNDLIKLQKKIVNI